MNSKHRKPTRRPILLLAALACAGLLAAAPAQAGNEFRDGFEDQLGRLAAVGVFHLGTALLVGHHAPHTHYATQVSYETHYPRHAIAKHRHHRHCRHPGRHVGHHRGGKRHGAHAARHRSHGYVEEVEYTVVRRRHH